RTLTLKFLGIRLARDPNHQTEVSVTPGLDSGEGILDYNCTFRLYVQQLGCHQERIRRRLTGKFLRLDYITVDLNLEVGIQFGSFQDSVAVLTRGDDCDLEPLMAKLIDKPDASLIRFHPFFFNDFVDKCVLSIAEATDCFGLRRPLGISFGQVDIT